MIYRDTPAQDVMSSQALPRVYANILNCQPCVGAEQIVSLCSELVAKYTGLQDFSEIVKKVQHTPMNQMDVDAILEKHRQNTTVEKQQSDSLTEMINRVSVIKELCHEVESISQERNILSSLLSQ